MVRKINGPSGDGFDKELYLKAQETLKSQGKTISTSADIKAAMDKLKAKDNNPEKPIKGFDFERSGETFVDFEEVQMMPTMITKSVSYIGKEEGEMKPLPSVVGQESGEMVPQPSELGKEGGIALPKPSQKPQLTDEELEKIKDLLKQILDILESPEKPETGWEMPSDDEWQKILDRLKFKEGVRDQVTTTALGEEGGDVDQKSEWDRIMEKFRKGQESQMTTMALGEEGGKLETTKAMGEEGGENHATTMALNEEGGSQLTTMALGEEGGDDGATTKAIGEEGGGYEPARQSLDFDEIVKELKKKYPELFESGKLTSERIIIILNAFNANRNVDFKAY